jgi:hypothetical protein
VNLKQTESQRNSQAETDKTPRTQRTGFLQVVWIIVSGLLMVGKKQTWEEGGSGYLITPMQIVASAIIGGIVLVATLFVIARIAIELATP